MPAELKLTPRDVAWLSAIDDAMKPKGVVPVEQYCNAAHAAEYITRRNYVLRQQRKKLLRRLRGIRQRQFLWGAWVFTALYVLGVGWSVLWRQG